MNVCLCTRYCLFCLFHRTTDCVVSKSYTTTGQLKTIGRLSSSSSSSECQPRAASFFPFFHVNFHLLSSLRMLLLIAVLKYLFIGWRWMVAVRRGRRIGAHHHMCHGNTWVATCHAVDPKALHTSWLLGNWKDEETVII